MPDHDRAYVASKIRLLHRHILRSYKEPLLFARTNNLILSSLYAGRLPLPHSSSRSRDG